MVRPLEHPKLSGTPGVLTFFGFIFFGETGRVQLPRRTGQLIDFFFLARRNAQGGDDAIKLRRPCRVAGGAVGAGNVILQCAGGTIVGGGSAGTATGTGTGSER